MKILFLLTSLLFAGIAWAENDRSLEQILAAPHRSVQHKARDVYRHPGQTLEFFDVKKDMTVVEIWPGGAGWYTEILAPFLKDKGRLYAAHFATDSKIAFFQKNRRRFEQKMAQNLPIYEKVIITELQPPDKMDIAPAGSADRVLTFRNVHNWLKQGQAQAVFNAMFKALKSGGILGVVEHRLPPDRPQDEKALSGYVSEQQVIALAQQAGFRLLAKSQINANPKDTADHPEGVWTLPPTLRLQQKDREKYLTIGESDRMTLKFIKPR